MSTPENEDYLINYVYQTKKQQLKDNETLSNPIFHWSRYGMYGRWDNNLEERKMNKAIINVFEKSKDAQLVDKYFGDDLPCDDDFLNEMFLRMDPSGILSECKRREKEDKAKK